MIDWRVTQERLGKLYAGKVDGSAGPKTWIGLVDFAAEALDNGSDAVTLRGRKLAEVAGAFELTTPDRIAGFLANTSHETSDYRRLRENLFYTSAERIRATWPSRFKTVLDAAKFVRQPEALANKVYARPREGNTEAGDGWRYRGGGDFQVTFRNGFRAAGDDLDVPLEDHPELIETPEIAVWTGLSVWRRLRLARFYDAGQPKRARALVNAGNADYPNPIGWDDVDRRHRRLRELFA